MNTTSKLGAHTQTLTFPLSATATNNERCGDQHTLRQPLESFEDNDFAILNYCIALLSNICRIKRVSQIAIKSESFLSASLAIMDMKSNDDVYVHIIFNFPFLLK